MAQAVLEKLVQPARIDALFERTAQHQYQRQLLFSSVVELMHAVVLGIEPPVNAGNRRRGHGTRTPHVPTHRLRAPSLLDRSTFSC